MDNTNFRSNGSLIHLLGGYEIYSSQIEHSGWFERATVAILSVVYS